MEVLRDSTIQLTNTLFYGYNDTQKRNNVRFLHSTVVYSLAILFLFAPSRSWARILSYSLYILFIGLYIILGNCWVYEVENSFEKVEDDAGVLGPLRDLLGFPHDAQTKRIFTSLGYFFVCLTGTMLLLRDSFGIY